MQLGQLVRVLLDNINHGDVPRIQSNSEQIVKYTRHNYSRFKLRTPEIVAHYLGITDLLRISFAF